MTRARDIADSTKTLSVDGGTIKLDGNYPVGTGNVALGDTSLSAVTTGGNYNTAVGANTLKLNTSGNQNAAFGFEALRENTTGSNNTAVGLYAGLVTTTGGSNVAIGTSALYSNTTASNNTAVGYQSLYDNTTGANNIAVGGYSLWRNTTANNNTSMGYSTLSGNTTGGENTAFGRSALGNNTTASRNTAVGYQALLNNTTASYNVAMGYQAGYNITTAGFNTILGYHAGDAGNITESVIIGYSAGTALTGEKNTIVGSESGKLITSGAKNTIIGRYNGNQGGLDIRTSSNNIVLSDGDGNPRISVNVAGHVGFHNNTVNGKGVLGGRFVPESSGRDTLYLGNSSTANRPMVYFYNGNGYVGYIETNGSSTLYSTSSDYRLKENVVGLTGATDRLKQLNPSRFNFIADANTTVDGFLAHEVQAVVPEAISGTKDAVDAEGNPVYQGIDQAKLVPLLVATIKELEARITALENA